MSVLSLLLLIGIIYLCGKALGNIWRDAFGTMRRSSSASKQQHTQQQTTTHKDQPSSQKPIQQGEGEYVDYEEL